MCDGGQYGMLPGESHGARSPPTRSGWAATVRQHLPAHRYHDDLGGSRELVADVALAAELALSFGGRGGPRAKIHLALRRSRRLVVQVQRARNRRKFSKIRERGAALFCEDRHGRADAVTIHQGSQDAAAQKSRPTVMLFLRRKIAAADLPVPVALDL